NAPFAGVPLLLKDIRPHDFMGMPTSNGCAALRDNLANRHSHLVRRLMAAGFIILGKTNTPEFGLKATTEPAAFGPTHNPWHPDYTAGGSSGGSAAAVAAGIVPLATASDGGGSIRIPSAYCGLYGLKPSRARVSAGPDQAPGWDGLTCDHVLTRSVRDSAAMLDAVAGPDVGAPYVAPPPVRPYGDEVGRSPGRLRIAFTTEPLMGTSV
ncbi:MAG: amidase, partial [Actinobacteria bacterium]|nr:amidase [Actinomycetota bacterium]